jgi:hypothetical protein
LTRNPVKFSRACAPYLFAADAALDSGLRRNDEFFELPYCYRPSPAKMELAGYLIEVLSKIK